MRRRPSIGAPDVPLFLPALALVALALAGCGFGPPAATPFTVDVPAATAGADPTPIFLVDQTGLVTGISIATDAGATGEGVEVAPGVANALRVSWAGGPCDDRETLVLNDIGGGRFELAIHNHPPITAGFSCDDSAILRVVDITFNQHLDPAQLTLNVTYP